MTHFCIVIIRLTHKLLNFNCLCQSLGCFFSQILLLSKSSQSDMRFGLAGNHLKVETERNDEERAQQDSADRSNQDDASARESFGVVVSISNCGHCDKGTPKAVCIVFEASGQSGVIQKKYSLRQFESISKDHQKTNKIYSNGRQRVLI